MSLFEQSIPWDIEKEGGWVVGWVENQFSPQIFFSHPKVDVIHKNKDSGKQFLFI